MMDNLSNERQDFWASLGVVGLVFVIGLGLSGYVFQQALESKRDHLSEMLTHRAESHTVIIQSAIDESVAIIESVGGFYGGSSFVDRSEFRRFVSNLLAQHRTIQALEWIPRVSRDQRSAFEERARRDGLSGFRFTERQSQGKMITAMDREEYFPVFYLEPLAGNKAALGFDLASNPTRLDALAHARDLDTIYASRRITLVQEHGSQFGLLIFRPVYAQGKPASTIEDRRKHLQGFALGVFRIGDLIRGAIRDLAAAGVHFTIREDGAAKEREPLYRHAPRSFGTPVNGDLQSPSENASIHQVEIKVPGGSWTATFWPSPEMIALHSPQDAWLTFFIGILLTLVVSTFLYHRFQTLGESRKLVSKLRNSETRLARERGVLATVDRTLSSFIGRRDFAASFDRVLVDLLKLTESRYGFVAEYCADEDGAPYLQTLAISNIAWDTESRRFYEENASSGYKFYDFDALYAAAVVTGEAVITDDPAHHPHAKGTPEGHPKLESYLGVPLKRGTRIIGTVGVANREGGYDEELVDYLTPFWNALAEIIDAKQTESARQESVQMTEQLAHYDVLTGLPNRAHFQERLDWAVKQVKRYDQPFALLLLDLDHFKDVNDTVGHTVGDELLVAVAERLKSAIRESDVVSRLGGDEFAILQMGLLDTGAAAIHAHRICNMLATPFDINGHKVHTGVSIGIAVYGPDHENADDLLTQADTALYRVKAEGRGGFRFHDPEMEATERKRVEIIEDLHHAIAGNHFLLNFQPQVNALVNRLSGVEALVRWKHPDRGIVGPNVFIPIAEESGQLLAIDNWVLNEACTQMSVWQAQGVMRDTTIAVNLSPLQFKSSDFEESVISALEKSRLDPKCLELEVTERTLAERPDEVAKIMRRLNERGVKFSIDDFGTGYSSLQYLKTLPVYKIKIAQEFVWEMLKNSQDASIVKAIIGLSRDLGHDVLAEGVETEEQLSHLLSGGCHLIQGYYFSKPLPPDELEKWLDQTKYRLPGETQGTRAS